MFEALNRGRGRIPTPTGGPTVFERHEAGMQGGSGFVAGDAPIEHTNPDAGGAIEDLGRHVVQTSPQPADALRPIPGVVTRPMLGGLRVSRRTELLRETPHFRGGHVEIRGRAVRRSVDPANSVLPVPTAQIPSLRVPPVSDPLGRMCANAAAKAGQ